MKWYEMNAKQQNAEILIYDEIGAYGVSAKNFAMDLKALGSVKNINVRINSPGGSVMDGNAIYNTLRQNKANVNVQIDGMALSMGSVIAMAGDSISMAENAMLMIHNPWGMAVGDADQLRKEADVMDKMKGTLVGAYTRKTGIKAERIAELMDAETWMNSSEALAEGFIDEITDEIELAAHFDLSKFENVPDHLKKTINLTIGGNVLGEITSWNIRDGDIEDIGPHATTHEGTSGKLYADSGMTIDGWNINNTSTSVKVADNTSEGNPMKTDKATDTVDIEQATKEAARVALQNEKARTDEIRSLFKAHGNKYAVLMDNCLEDQDVKADSARKLLLDEIGKNKESLGGHIELVTDSRDNARVGLVQAFAMRSGREKRDQTNEFSSFSLMDVARHCLRVSNVSTTGMTKMQIVAAAFTHTTSDFPYLLEDTIGKELQAAYGNFPETWSRIADVGSVPDFKTNSRIRLGSFNSLEVIPEGLEYTSGTFSEEREQITAATKGKMISLNRQMIINDDLGGFNSIAQMMGRAAARTVGNDVYSVINTNAAMSDTVAIFHADHNNLAGTGAAPTTTTVGAGRSAMRLQTDVDGNDSLDIRPAIFLVPVALEDTANVLVASETDPNQANSRKPNPIRGFAEVVSDPRLDATSTTAWYLIASPSLAPLVEVAFLDGNQTPYLESQNGFTIDGVMWKVRMDYGTAAIDWRGGYKNAGA